MVATKSTAGVNNSLTTQGVINNSHNAKAVSTDSAAAAAAAAATTITTTTASATTTAVIEEKSVKLHANTVILKTVSAFLANSRRISRSQSKVSEVSLKPCRRLKKEKMDELSGKINPKFLEHLRKKTKFNKDELDALYRIYRKLISNCQYATKSLVSGSSGATIVKPQTLEGIDRIVFRELLHSTFDIVTEEILMERIFCSWDKAYEGLPLRLESWLVGLSVFLRGSVSERAAFCFRVYDLNGDGFITKDEMFTLLRNCLIKQPQDEDPDEGVKDLVEIVLRKFDLDKDGKVSLEDFMQTVTAQPLLMEAFGQCLPTESAIISFFSTLHL